MSPVRAERPFSVRAGRWRAAAWDVALVPLLLAPALPARAAEASAAFAELIRDVVAFREDEHPLPVPPGVDPRYDDRLPAVSEELFRERAARIGAFRERLRGLDRGALERDEGVDARILESQLRDEAAELEFRGYEIPIGSRQGFHFDLALLALRAELRSVGDYDAYVAKLQSALEHVRRQIALMRAGIAAGRVLPRAVLDGYEQTVAPHAVETPEQSELFAPLAEIPSSFPADDRERLLRDGTAAIRDSILPAFRTLRDFFRDEYVPASRRSLGMGELPRGAEWYRQRILHHTTLPMSPREIHELGLREVARLREEMQAVIARTGFEGSFEAFVEMLRTDPRFAAASEEEYLAAVALAAKRMDGALPLAFGLLPRTPYGIRPMPPRIAPRQSAGYYDRGEADGTRAGFVNVNTSDLPARPLYVAEALAFHEGVPGHHVQIMLTRENESLSQFRRSLGITAFTEGWGLYAESLGRELGFYADPYSDFGRLTYEIWRAVRLVVDSGVHALGWSRERAIDYMAANTGFQRGPATAEVDRHITEAGQGLAYTVGLLKIRELRERAERALGDRFDRRAFHDALLRNGPLPLDLLEEEMHAWLAEAVAED